MDTLYGDLPAPKSSRSSKSSAGLPGASTAPPLSHVAASIRHVVPPPAVLRKRARPSVVTGKAHAAQRRAESSLSKIEKDEASHNVENTKSDETLRETCWTTEDIIEEEYDPMRPNEYSEVKERIREKQHKRSADVLEKEDWERLGEGELEQDKHMRRRTGTHLINEDVEADDMDVEEQGEGSDRALTGEEAYLRRGQLSRTRMKANMAKGRAKGNPSDASKSKGSTSMSVLHNDAVKKMMEKMGWREGQGLGSKCEGRVEPIDAQVNCAEGRRGLGDTRRTGRGSESGGNRMERERGHNASFEGSGHEQRSGISRVLVLRNMVRAEDVDEALEEETRVECEKYGIVEKVVVHVVCGRATPDEHAVRIFVAFRDSDSGAKALLALDGRFFAGRTVRASFFPEHEFMRGNLTPTAYFDDSELC